MNKWIVSSLLSALSIFSAIGLQAAEQEEKPTPAIVETTGTRVTGQLMHIEGWHYTIKDTRGEEVSFGVTSVTKDPDKVKEGDYIVAMIGDDRIALSVKNMKKKN
ncbi:MAG TPA: hypothetical protein VFR82_06325 [Nitrospira sp.]|nr:hypothetical protein [Nitrospira sp.]